jgi:GNAT superfamily N-acetyltransferase
MPKDQHIKSLSSAATIRYLSPDDDLTAITELIHAAYAHRATANLRYWATHQSVEDTAKRYAQGQGLIAELDGKIVGTLTVKPHNPNSAVPLFRQATTWTLGQFGVLPELQGKGIGRRLHDAAHAHVRKHGGQTIALDTAAPATELIAMYERWGYAVVGECDWRPHTNYLSVVMARSVIQDAP